MKSIIRLRRFSTNDRYRLVKFANNEMKSKKLRDEFPYPFTLTDAENFLSVFVDQEPNHVFAIEYNVMLNTKKHHAH